MFLFLGAAIANQTTPKPPKIPWTNQLLKLKRNDGFGKGRGNNKKKKKSYKVPRSEINFFFIYIIIISKFSKDVYFQWMQNPNFFYSEVGLKPEDFQKLLNEREIQQLRNRHRKRSRLNFQNELLFFFSFLFKNKYLSTISDQFQVKNNFYKNYEIF